MAKKLPYTPNSQIRSALRRLFLRSRERAAALKRDGYTCQICGAKQSKAKGREVATETDHIGGVLNWPELFKAIREYLLCNPDKLRTLCSTCHKTKTKEGGQHVAKTKANPKRQKGGLSA
jgi:5-methylcytosine-specific restriction endonuclease McrA